VQRLRDPLDAWRSHRALVIGDVAAEVRSHSNRPLGVADAVPVTGGATLTCIVNLTGSVGSRAPTA